MDTVPADALATGLVEVDRDDTVVAISELVAKWAGVPSDEVCGRPIGDLLRTPPPITGDPLEYLPSVAEIIPPDGSRFPVLVAEGTRAEDGRRYLTLFDAREQRAFKDQLQSRHSRVARTQTRLELVISASISFAEARDEKQLSEILTDTTARAYAAEEAVVFLLDDDMVFRHAAGTNPFSGIRDIEALTVMGNQLRGVLKISGRAAADDLAPAVGEAFEAAGVQAMIIAPIHQGSQLLGILAAFFHHPREFDEEASPLADALAGQAARAVTALRLQRRLEHAALHDDTTGLPNRRFLEERSEIAERAAGTLAAVLFVDLDGFKAVNDQLGHHVGDELLRLVGQRLQAAVRESDVVARYGGDEFVIICEVTSDEAAANLAERIQDTIHAPYGILPPSLRIGASIGISLGSPDSNIGDIDQLVRAADQAMYLAKNAGGNRIVAAGV